VYKGVFVVEELALTHAAASKKNPIPTTTSDIFCALFILTPPFLFYTL
jgi:hypothetical protein